MVAKNAAEVEATFKRGDLAKSKKYAADRDLIMALLTADGEYTIKQVDDILTKFKKGKV